MSNLPATAILKTDIIGSTVRFRSLGGADAMAGHMHHHDHGAMTKQ